jgi:hypothetical protein
MTASVSLSGTTATVTISKSGGITPAAMQTLVNGIAYKNTSNNPTTSNRVVTLTSIQGSGGTANGGVDTSTLSIASTVTVLTVNIPPTLTATANNPTFTEGGSAATLYSSTAITTVKTGQTILQVGLTVTNITDGTNEILNIDGSSVALTNGNSVTTATNGMTASVSLSGTTATVTISKSGGITPAAMQTLVNGIAYKNTSNNATTNNRVVTLTLIQGSGGTANGGVDTSTLSIASTVTVAAVKNIPVLSGIEGTIINYTEGNAALQITNTITANDGNKITLASATVCITNNFLGGQDVLSFTSNNGISGSYNGATGVMKLSGISSVANYQIALRSVKYQNISQDPSTATRTVSFIVNDGSTNSNILSRQISITAVNNPPVLSAIEKSAINFTEGNPAIQITNTITASDVDNKNLASATVSITGNFLGGQDVLSFTNQNGITGIYNGATGVMTLNGSSSLANYQTALRSVMYQNTSQDPSTATRTVSFLVNDGSANSDTLTRQIKITAIDNPPVLFGIEGTSINYIEGDTGIQITNTITASDVDNITLASASISIIGDFRIGEDVLSFTNQNGIKGSYNSVTGVMTLSGISSISNYQTALRSVKYQDTSQNPSTSTRTVSFIVNDGSVNSNTVYRSITMSSLYLTSPTAESCWKEGATATITWTSINVTNIKIEISTNDGNDWTIIDSSVSAETGGYAYCVNVPASDKCMIRITDLQNPKLFAISGITIINYNLVILAPEGGENWSGGSKQNITWTSNSIEFVNIDFSIDSGKTWSNIAKDFPADSDKYTWKIPDTSSTNALVRIISTSDLSINSISKGVFNINFTNNISHILNPYVLFQNYPNPFNSTTIIQYNIPESGIVTLKIYTLLGREIVTLINQLQPAGNYIVNFNSSGLASGIYMYKFQSGGFTSTKKMMLIK